MESQISQLVEMGATVHQARTALARCKDVMQAAERIFDREFIDVQEDGRDARMEYLTSEREVVASLSKSHRLVTPEEDDDDGEAASGDDAVMEDDSDGGDYVDYDSDFGEKSGPACEVDPYSGIFFSKDRREEVIEIEEEPDTVFLPEINDYAKIMTQGQWMKGCPEGSEQSFLFALYSQLNEGVCPCPHQCGFSVKREKSHFFPIFPEFAMYIEHLRKTVNFTCSKCRRAFCLACGETFVADRNQRTSGDESDPLFHCSNLQGVILGIGLSMLEALCFEQKQPSNDGEHFSVDTETSQRGKKRRKVDQLHHSPSVDNPTDDDDDDFHSLMPMVMSATRGRRAKGGTGYAGDLVTKEDTSGQAEAHAMQLAKDEKIGKLLKDIRLYLPSLHRPSGARTSDYMVHPTTLAHLRRRFNYLCSSLLRNDSLSDMSDRSILYFELFEWLETISNHEALASMMAMPIMVPSTTQSVTARKVSQKGQSAVRERTIVYEGSSGPRELMEAIVIQAQSAIKGLESMKPAQPQSDEMTEEQKRMTHDEKGKTKEKAAPVSEENQKLLAFCRRILSTAEKIDRSLRETKGDAFVDRLHASLPKISSSSDGVIVAIGATDEATQSVYVDWATKVRFEYCDLTTPPPTRNAERQEGGEQEDTPHYKFAYNSEARTLAHSDIPKRSLAIAKELAVLTTNLPVAWESSIFLRVDESRVDIIKALIIGPEGTPYCNGCFQFDIFLGSSYNQAPPSVKYMTTYGGIFRLNPNLYADGKVCLSLLGTWQGPGWVAGRSTLLQVLISIQSMILCEEPYLNEPGWGSAGDTPQSHAYSANVRRMVVKAAMLDSLKHPPEPFGDIVRTHFQLKAKFIINQLHEWLALDDGQPISNDHHARQQEASTSSSSFREDVEQLQRLLRELQISGTINTDGVDDRR